MFIIPLFLLIMAWGVAGCSIDGVFPVPPATQPPSITSTATTPPLSPTLPPTITPTPSPTPVPAVRIASGDQALFIGDWDTALKEYQAAIDASILDPDANPEIITAAIAGIGRTHYLRGEYAPALNALRGLVDEYPDSPHRAEAFFFLAQTFTALSRFGEAADAYQRYLALKPGVIDAYIYELRGDALTSAGDYSGALVDYQIALQSPRTGARSALEIKIARTYAITGDYATALVMYNDIYARSTSDSVKAQVDLLLGQTYLAVGEAGPAYAAYLDAVQNYPASYSSYLALVELVTVSYPVDELDRGLVDYYAGEYAVAIEAFDRYLNAGGADPATARYYKGLTLLALDDVNGALTQWDIVIENYPSSSVWDDAWEQKGYALWAYLGDYTGGARTLAGFVDAIPGHARGAEFLFDAGRAAERGGELELAASLWERITAEYPTSPDAFYSLHLAGLAHYRLENYAAAQSVFERLLAISTNITQRAAAYFWIGKAQQAQGNTDGARSSWTIAADMDATGYYSERARDLLIGREPFAPPQAFDLTFDLSAEKIAADEWMRTTFSLSPDVDLNGLGPLASDGHTQRGTALWELGLYSEARNEFETLRGILSEDPLSTYRLAGYFSQIGLYRSSVLAARQVLTLAGMDDAETMNAPVYFNHIRFGTYYSELILPVAQKYGFHPLVIFSVVRQESLFEPFAASSASARGLMQIMPATGQGIFALLGWPPYYTTADLNRPLVSVTFGVDYLSDQFYYLDRDLHAALAGYNGGPGNARIWKDLAGDDPDLFLETIRFEETRRYVRSIYEIFAIYRRLYDRTP